MRSIFVALLATAAMATITDTFAEKTEVNEPLLRSSKRHQRQEGLLERARAPTRERENVDMRVSVDTLPLQSMLRDFEKFGVTYWEDTEDERESLLPAFKQAYANTAAKVIMNFGKAFTPVAEEWAEIMQDVQVNP